MKQINYSKATILSTLLRQLRIRQVLPVIKQYDNVCLLDVGCGYHYKLLQALEPFIARGVGVDAMVPAISNRTIATKQIDLDKSLPFENQTFDIVTMLAVLEHLSNPKEIVDEIYRVLKDSGRLILTVPSKLSKPVLEFLAYRLRLLSAEPIRDHKRYYNYKDLKAFFENTNFTIERHRYFQLGMNNILVAQKMSDKRTSFAAQAF